MCGSVCGCWKERKTHQFRNHQKGEYDGKYNKAHKGLSLRTADDCWPDGADWCWECKMPEATAARQGALKAYMGCYQND